MLYLYLIYVKFNASSVLAGYNIGSKRSLQRKKAFHFDKYRSEEIR